MVNRIPEGIHLLARIISVHAETLAQKYGITAAYGVPERKEGDDARGYMEYDEDEGVWSISGQKMFDGTTISIDGHENQLLYHNSGNIYLGSVPVVEIADGKVEVERMTPRALERIRELRDQEQWQEAQESKSTELIPFEKEVLAAFQEYINGIKQRGKLIGI